MFEDLGELRGRPQALTRFRTSLVFRDLNILRFRLLCEDLGEQLDMMMHLRRRSESTHTMLRRHGGGALVYRAWSDTVRLPELSIWDLFRYLGDHLTTIYAPWTAPGQHCGHLLFPCPAKVPFGVNLGEKSTQFRGMFLAQNSIKIIIHTQKVCVWTASRKKIEFRLLPMCSKAA